MKKRISAVLALLLLLTACGGPAAETAVPTQGAVMEETPSPTPTETATPEPTEPPYTGPFVYTDWSKLEPYQPKTNLYTRRYEGFTDTLIPAEDYGPLVSFAGASLTGNEEWSYYMGYHDIYYLYGLVTLTGEVVMDPVLTSAFYLTESDWWGNQAHQSDLMLLGKVFYDEEGRPEERFALCAGDGRWCTDFLYEYNWGSYQDVSFSHGVPMVQQRSRLVFLDPDSGEELRSLDLAGAVDAEDFSLSGFDMDLSTGWITVNLYIWKEEEDVGLSIPLAFDPQGEVHYLPKGVQWIERYGDGLIPAGGDMDETDEDYAYRYGYVDMETGEWAIPPVYTWCGRFENGRAWVSDDTGTYLINTAGEVLSDAYTTVPTRHGDYWYVVKDYYLVEEVLDLNLNRVESPLVGVVSFSYQEDGWVCGKTSKEWILARGNEVHRFSIELGDFVDLWGERMLFCRSRGDNRTAIITLTDLEGNVIAQWDRYTWAYLSPDRVNGGCYVSCYSYLEENNWGEYYDMDGNRLAVGKTDYGHLEGGLFCSQSDDSTTLSDLEGNVVFCWTFLADVD